MSFEIPSPLAHGIAAPERLEPAELLVWAERTFGRRVACASSFGAEDAVLIDLIARHAPTLRIFTLDTGRLPEETYEVLERVRRRYGLTIETLFPEREAVERLEQAKGPYSFRDGIGERKECCGIRKVEPLKRMLSGLDAWITGLRREQSVTRAAVARVEIDLSFGRHVKINPLADWTSDDVWRYVRAHDVPYNRLHDLGYPSIGCAPCTRAVAPGEDERSGRWWWERPEQKECGLHGRPTGTS